MTSLKDTEARKKNFETSYEITKIINDHFRSHAFRELDALLKGIDTDKESLFVLVTWIRGTYIAKPYLQEWSSLLERIKVSHKHEERLPQILIGLG